MPAPLDCPGTDAWQALLTSALPADDQDPDAPIELSDEAQRFLQLFHEEEQRRQAHRTND